MSRTLTPSHVTVVSIHPLYDTRIQNHLHTLVQAGFHVSYVNWSPGAQAADLDRYSDVRLIHRSASSAFGWNLFRYAWMLCWMFRQIRATRANLVHLHDVLLLPLVWPLRCTGRRPIVFDVHEHYLQAAGMIGPFARLSYRLFLPFVHGLVAVSQSTLPGTKQPARIIPNYQRRAHFAAHEPPSTNPTQAVSLVYFGSLSSEDRDVNLLIEVADQVLNASPQAHFKYGGRLVGNDAETNLQRLQDLERRHPGRFQWFGEMARDHVVRETASADIGLLLLKPNTFNLKGANPNKVFEYAAAGVAIVATEGFEITAEVRAVNAGRPVPAGIPNAELTQILLSLIADGAQLAAMKEASRLLGHKYTWENVAQEYLDLYQELGVTAPTLETLAERGGHA